MLVLSAFRGQRPTTNERRKESKKLKLTSLPPSQVRTLSSTSTSNASQLYFGRSTTPTPTRPSTQQSVLSALQQLFETRRAEDVEVEALLKGYCESKLSKGISKIGVEAKLTALEKAVVAMLDSQNNGYRKGLFERSVSKIRRELILPPSKVFPLPSLLQTSSSSTAVFPPRPRSSLPDLPLEVLVMTQESVLRGLSSTRASEGGESGHAFVRELLMGYVEQKRKSGNPPVAVSAKLVMVEREMLRLEMTSFAADVQEVRLLLGMPPSQTFPSPINASSSNPRPSAYALRRPPVVRDEATTEPGGEGEEEGPPPAYEARDSNPSTTRELEEVMTRTVLA
ncbi:hypothetical protein BDY24DRAFT_392443 [Mrakia frigida]|uniref:uncharacterized protein n=1 Tax=Mrakia frigida TaxID=29902 RepID=UPI003FCC215D